VAIQKLGCLLNNDGKTKNHDNNDDNLSSWIATPTKRLAMTTTATTPLTVPLFFVRTANIYFPRRATTRGRPYGAIVCLVTFLCDSVKQQFERLSEFNNDNDQMVKGIEGFCAYTSFHAE
jgi:hypothetical protein